MLDVVSITVYDRDTLLNIGSSVVQRKPYFEFLNAGGLFTDTALEPFVWAAQSRKRRRRRKRGKRAGVLVRLRCRAFRSPLPTILLANVQSLDNKLCELSARISYQRETRDCCVICLTETWMSAMVPDSAIELTGFSVHRSDRAKELTGKSRGGGVCFYINNSWCNERNIHSIKSFCSPDLEFHTLLCRPFWLPREAWDWDMFQAASDDDIEAYSDTVTCFIRKCIDDVVPTKTIRIYPNQKPWINSDVRSALSARTSAFKSGNTDDRKQASYDLRRSIKAA